MLDQRLEFTQDKKNNECDAKVLCERFKFQGYEEPELVFKFESIHGRTQVDEEIAQVVHNLVENESRRYQSLMMAFDDELRDLLAGVPR